MSLLHEVLELALGGLVATSELILEVELLRALDLEEVLIAFNPDHGAAWRFLPSFELVMNLWLSFLVPVRAKLFYWSILYG